MIIFTTFESGSTQRKTLIIHRKLLKNMIGVFDKKSMDTTNYNKSNKTPTYL